MNFSNKQSSTKRACKTEEGEEENPVAEFPRKWTVLRYTAYANHVIVSFANANNNPKEGAINKETRTVIIALAMRKLQIRKRDHMPAYLNSYDSWFLKLKFRKRWILQFSSFLSQEWVMTRKRLASMAFKKPRVNLTVSAKSVPLWPRGGIFSLKKTNSKVTHVVQHFRLSGRGRSINRTAQILFRVDKYLAVENSWSDSAVGWNISVWLVSDFAQLSLENSRPWQWKSFPKV